MSGYTPPPPHRTAIEYPDVPDDLYTRLNTLLSHLETAVSHLNGSSTNIQTFAGQASGAIQHVGSISSGNATNALLETWLLSHQDITQSHSGMSDASLHLNGTTQAFYDHLPTIKDGMDALEQVKQWGGTVLDHYAPDYQHRIDDMSTALNNIGMALDGAASLLNALNNGWPLACATGFTPGNPPQTFTASAFNNSIMHMSGNGLQSALSSDAGQQLVQAVGQDDAEMLIEIAQQNGFALSDITNWLKSGMSVDEIEKLLINPTFPHITLPSGQQALFTTLAQKYPSLDPDFLIYLLSLNPQGKYLTIDKIEETLATIGRINGNATGVEEQNLARTIAILEQTGVPGTDKVVYDLFNGNKSATDYLGSRFQLSWVNDHLGDVQALEVFRPNGDKGVDVLLKNGDFVDTKSYKDLENYQKLTDQISAYNRDFPSLSGHTLTFVFDSSALKSGPRALANLQSRLQAYVQQQGYTFTVDVTTYP